MPGPREGFHCDRDRFAVTNTVRGWPLLIVQMPERFQPSNTEPAIPVSPLANGRSHDTFITLYRNSDRVDIRNELTANFGDVRHWAFSFALNEPAVHTEEVGARQHDRVRSQVSGSRSRAALLWRSGTAAIMITPAHAARARRATAGGTWLVMSTRGKAR